MESGHRARRRRGNRCALAPDLCSGCNRRGGLRQSPDRKWRSHTAGERRITGDEPLEAKGRYVQPGTCRSRQVTERLAS